MSYWKGDTSEPLQNSTIGQLLEQSVTQYANRTAISYYGGQRLTYAEVLEKVDTLAAAYIKLGLKRGDHVAIWGFNTVEWYLSYLAGFRAGLVMVNLNPLHESSEILMCLTVGDVKALIMDECLNERNFYDILKTAVPGIEQHDYNSCVTCEEAPLLKTIIMFTDEPYKGTYRWSDLFTLVTDDQIQQIKHNQSLINTFDICTMPFTSGTTSKPKGVLLTHRALVNNSKFIAKHMGLYEKAHRVCVQIPLFHAYGIVAGILATLHAGATVVIPHMKFSPNKTISCIIEEKCTVIYGTPTMYIDIFTISEERSLKNPQIYDQMNCVERLLTASAICLPEIVMKSKKLFKNSEFISAFGMTETSGITFMTQREDTDDKVLNTVGRVMPHTEVKVVDKNDELVPLGSAGEMCFGGYMLMKGYYKEEVKTKEVISADRWFHSGDQFILMENGYSQVFGRIKDIIIRGGENIEPKEVEGLLITHPDVTDVQVYGVSDSRLGEAVAVAIVKKVDSKITEHEVKEYCRNKIATYKIPQHVIFVSGFSRTTLGKVMKSQLRQMTETYLKEKR